MARARFRPIGMQSGAMPTPVNQAWPYDSAFFRSAAAPPFPSALAPVQPPLSRLAKIRRREPFPLPGFNEARAINVDS